MRHTHPTLRLLLSNTADTQPGQWQDLLEDLKAWQADPALRIDPNAWAPCGAQDWAPLLLALVHHWAVRKEVLGFPHVEVFDWLVEQGADPKALTAQGHRLLDLAPKKNRTALAMKYGWSPAQQPWDDQMGPWRERMDEKDVGLRLASVITDSHAAPAYVNNLPAVMALVADYPAWCRSAPGEGSAGIKRVAQQRIRHLLGLVKQGLKQLDEPGQAGLLALALWQVHRARAASPAWGDIWNPAQESLEEALGKRGHTLESASATLLGYLSANAPDQAAYGWLSVVRAARDARHAWLPQAVAGLLALPEGHRYWRAHEGHRPGEMPGPLGPLRAVLEDVGFHQDWHAWEQALGAPAATQLMTMTMVKEIVGGGVEPRPGSPGVEAWWAWLRAHPSLAAAATGELASALDREEQASKAYQGSDWKTRRLEALAAARLCLLLPQAPDSALARPRL